MSDTYRVQRRTADGRTTTLFDGNEEDAHTYVQNNFPRPHVEPGGTPDRLRADVQLVHPDGTRQEFHGAAGWVNIDSNDEVADDRESPLYDETVAEHGDPNEPHMEEV